MPASLLPDHIVEDRRAAARELCLALWALNRAPTTISIGEMFLAPALTIRLDVPCPAGMQPAQQLAQTRRFLREHGVDAHAEFCAEAYPRQALTLPTVADVWRLSTVVLELLPAPSAARYRLSRAARDIGIEWLSTVLYPNPHAPLIRPEDLSVGAAQRLHKALTQRPVALAVNPQDEAAVEELLDELTAELVTAAGERFLLYQTDEGAIRFSTITPEAAERLADALAQYTCRMRALLAVVMFDEQAS
ncbi:hypothetical protein [Streptomyces sp. MBT27]|uniref:hypothetical protein n=1 Tax=Streptomyces sp. MBT27 TaxID=1488356 RepID=UPI0019699D08|nr:hypothetical protein [Streptomyces sp. MBT27]